MWYLDSSHYSLAKWFVQINVATGVQAHQGYVVNARCKDLISKFPLPKMMKDALLNQNISQKLWHLARNSQSPLVIHAPKCKGTDEGGDLVHFQWSPRVTVAVTEKCDCILIYTWVTQWMWVVWRKMLDLEKKKKDSVQWWAPVPSWTITVHHYATAAAVIWPSVFQWNTQLSILPAQMWLLHWGKCVHMSYLKRSKVLLIVAEGESCWWRWHTDMDCCWIDIEVKEKSACS